jgi:FKBP-type peptidyl-prolyl cis-trans isomerase SlpA
MGGPGGAGFLQWRPVYRDIHGNCSTGFFPDPALPPGRPAGDIINTFDGKPATLSLGSGELSPAVEQRLIGLEEGTRATFELAPGEAFGERKADMVQWVARKLLDELGDPQEQYAVGEVVQFPTPDGQGQYAGAVRQVGDDGSVLFDFNHPLAGQPVTFEVLVIGVL